MAEITEILAIERVCFSDCWSESAVKEQVESPFGITLTHRYGYACGMLSFTECELYRIAVLPEWRGRGFGRSLLAEFVSVCRDRGAEKVFLEADEHNVKAISLYERYGFVKISKRKSYYGEHNACVYQLTL